MKFTKPWNVPLVLFICSFTLLAACAHRSAVISATARPDNKSAVLYGRFFINHDFAFKNQLALWLQNLDTHESTYLYFDPDQPVYGIRVRPGNYQVAGFVGVNRTHEIKARKSFPPGRFTLPFTVTAGPVNYLGDFSGSATYDSVVAEWRIRSITDNFGQTTEEFKQRFPKIIR